jgi:5-methylcytosine-specific restriction endonuclease McrA
MKEESMKVCRVCGEAKSIDQFEIDRRCKKSERTNRCKACKAKDNSRYRATLAGKIVKAFHGAKRRAAKAGVEDTLTIEQLRSVVEFFDGICPYCNSEIEGTLTIDHIIAMSLGGKNEAGNIAIAHSSCNRRKGNLPLLTFYEREPRFDDASLYSIVSYMSLVTGKEREEVLKELEEQRLQKGGGSDGLSA